MTIPLWVISVILILCYTAMCFYLLGIVFYILTNNKLGIFSENPVLWALLICIGGPGSYAIFRYVTLDLFLLEHYSLVKPNGWEFPNIKKIYVQECYVDTLLSIWGFNDGIRGRMFNNWKRF